MGAYVSLHVHTEFSLLDGQGLIKDLTRQAADLGHTHLAITDHGTMAGAAKFHSACREAGITPIVGLEAYVAPSGRLVRDTKNREQFHLTLLAINRAGYHNLARLATIGQTEGFYYKPRIDWDVLARHSDGLVCLSGCLASELSRAILADDDTLVAAVLDFYTATFPGRYLLELQNHGELIPDQQRVNRALCQLGLKYGLPAVGTNDVHFCTRLDYEAQKLLTAVNTGQKAGSDLILSSPYNYLRSDAEMRRAFGDSALLRNTLEVASWVEDYDLGTPTPKLPVSPAEGDGRAPVEILVERAVDGLMNRLGGAIPKEYNDRLMHELGVIQTMGEKLGVPFERYLLNVAGVTDFCRAQGIRFGPRGSAAGSLVSFALGISEPDPIKEGLLFERFLNEHRIELPDIDINVADNRRDDVMRYLLTEYGTDRVAKIGTYTAIGARMAIKDGARAIAHTLKGGDESYLATSGRLSSLIPHDTRPGGMPLEEALAAENSPLAAAVDGDPDAEAIIQAAKMIAGRLRQESTNAAGVVICDTPLAELLPLARVRDPDRAVVKVQTAFEYEYLEPLGILKMDVLGLSTLSVIEETVRSIARATGHAPEPWTFPTDDLASWRTIGNGHTMALFQLGSSGMTRLIREFRPKDIGELALVIAFYRPGPMQSLEEIVRRKKGERPADPPHPRLEAILRPTYGIPVFQEQVMAIMVEVAGFTLAEADIIRKAMGKKKRDLMARYEREFKDGGRRRGFRSIDLDAIWNFILPFADYGFNKAHAVCYAYLAYQSAYLKTHWPQHFYAAALTVEARGGNKANETPQMRVGTLALEARRNGIHVLPPDVNHSQPFFTPEGSDAVRYGLVGVKNVGLPDATAIARHAPYGSLADLVVNATPKRLALENLIQVGAVPFGNRSSLIGALPEAMALIRGRSKGATQRQALFGLGGVRSVELRPLPEWRRDEILMLEQERLGMFTSPLPLLDDVGATHTIGQLAEAIGERVTVYGVIAQIRVIPTRKGHPMAFVTITDGTAPLEIVIFPRLYAKVKEILQNGVILVVTGKIEERGEALSLLASSCVVPELGTEVFAAPVLQELVEVKLCFSPRTIDPADAVNRLKQAIEVASAQAGPLSLEVGYGGITERLPISRSGAQLLLQQGATAVWSPDRELTAGELIARGLEPDVLYAYTDGSTYKRNPGPESWAVVFVKNGRIVGEISGTDPHPDGTNNRAELEAVLAALQAKPTVDLTIVCDSELTIKIIQGVYSPKANLDLWQGFGRLMARREDRQLKTTWIHTRGHLTPASARWHPGHGPYNRRADDLAGAAGQHAYGRDA